MSSTDTPVPASSARPKVFLSYATEDREAARALRDALAALGLEVWYDESELTGGDTWDHKIRSQIKECDFFMPVISAHTEARSEGYFRREWRLAVERNLDMADDHIFLLPAVIDETPQFKARVPERFLQVQWTRVPGGQRNGALEALSRRMLEGDPQPTVRDPRVHHPSAHPPLGDLPPQPPPSSRRVRAAPPDFPEFPREEPGQRTRFWFQVAGWALLSGWALFQRFPRWVRVLTYLWLFIAVLSKMGSSSSGRHHEDLSAADIQKLGEIAQTYQGQDPADIQKLGTQIASQFLPDPSDGLHSQAPLLVIPFSAPASDPDALRVASSTFAQLFGRLVIAHHHGVALLPQQLSSPFDPSAAAEQGREHHSTYVIYGGVQEGSKPPSLTVSLLDVEDTAVVWTGSFPMFNADPAAIAAEVDSRVQQQEDSDDNDH